MKKMKIKPGMTIPYSLQKRKQKFSLYLGKTIIYTI